MYYIKVYTKYDHLHLGFYRGSDVCMWTPTIGRAQWYATWADCAAAIHDLRHSGRGDYAFCACGGI
jgi:hypothetical protein